MSTAPLLRLGDVAEIFMGASASYYSKSALEGVQQSLLVGGHSLDDNGCIVQQELTPVWEHDSKASRFLIRAGDILLLTRGNIRAGIAGEETVNHRLLASANVAIVRAKDPYANWTYLAELLNSARSRERMGLLMGSGSPSLRATDLKQALIPDIDSDTQQSIAEIREARQKAYTATLALADQHFVAATRLIDNMLWSKA